MMRVQKGWNEFWGPLLLLRCHEDNPARWSQREQRAEWLVSNLALTPGSQVLDLGCGDGILDICLARRGLDVTAVDRISTVLESARREPGAELVRFVHEDLRHVLFADASFDAVLMIDVVGLMGKADDARLLANAFSWLRVGGTILLDCPTEPKQCAGGSERGVDNGILRIKWKYERETRIQHIFLEFQAESEQIIELHDPYDSSQPDHSGVRRYLYPKEELAGMLWAAGFNPRETPSGWKDAYYVASADRGA